MESARAMLCHASLPNRYWAEAVGTATYLRNRVVTSAIKEGKTPYEKWYERKPDVSHLRVFGCVAYAHVPDCSRQKLDKKADKLRFIGYCTGSKGYRLIDEKTRKLVKSRDVIFNETEFDLVRSEAERTEMVDIDPESNGPEEVPEKEQQVREPRRSERQRGPPLRFIDEYADTGEVSHIAYKASDVIEPKTMDEALASDHADKWKITADSQYESLMTNRTWELVELPPDRDAISTPADPSVTLVKDDGVSKEVDPTLYQSMVGSLIYAAMTTRPDIAQAVGTVSKFNSKPSEAHFTAVKRIIRYHYIREAVQNKEIELKYCPSEEMIADTLTKAPPKARFKKLRYAMGMSMQES